jgi:spermidine/putrescine transport system permease protein
MVDLAGWAREAARLREQRERRTLSVLLGPASLWLGLFFLLPLAVILVYSFLTRGAYGTVIMRFTIDNYLKLFDENYFIVFRRSLVLALGTTIVCLVVSYPVAYFITRRSPKMRNLLVLLIIIPFWTNFLVRTYAWAELLRDQGVINNLLMRLGLINQPLDMLYTPGAVAIGLIYGYLPFMVLPLYANLEKFDHSLMEAAHDSGANNFWAFVRIMLPLTMPGIVAGCILVFIPSIGAFVSSDILGGSKVMMIGNLIERQFKTGRNWPFASTISITLMVLVSLGTALYFRITTEKDRL